VGARRPGGVGHSGTRVRILLIGPHWDTGRWTEYCTAGLRAGGHTVRSVIYSAELDQTVRMFGRLRRKLVGAHRFHLERVMDAMRRDNARALEAAEAHQPALIVVLKGEVLLPETVDRLRAIATGQVVQWCGDNPSWFPNLIGAAHLYHTFFLAEPSYGVDLIKHGARPAFLPHAADPAAWAPSDGEPVTAGPDVIFVGDARHNMGHLPANRDRVERLELVARLGVSLDVWGRGWEKLEETYAVRRHHRGLTLLPAAVVGRAYRAAKIVLNVHHAQMREGVNMRTFEIPAAGAFQLSDYKARMDGLFDVGAEIAVFRGDDELGEVIRHYLAHPAVRRDIAAAGRSRVLHDHTYEARMRELVEQATRT